MEEYMRECERNALEKIDNITLSQLLQEVLINKTATIEWCQNVGLLPNYKKCEKCLSEMILFIENGEFRCLTPKCYFQKTIYDNTYFSFCRNIHSKLLFMYFYSNGMTKYRDLIKHCSRDNKKLSPKTINGK